MESVKEILRGRVRKGAALLDMHKKNWRERINLDDLNMDAGREKRRSF